MIIKLDNGSVIEPIPSNNVTRGKGVKYDTLNEEYEQLKEKYITLCKMYTRGLVTFDWLVDYLCDEATYQYIKLNNDIGRYI